MSSLLAFLNAHLSKSKPWKDFSNQIKIQDFVLNSMDKAIKKHPVYRQTSGLSPLKLIKIQVFRIAFVILFLWIITPIVLIDMLKLCKHQDVKSWKVLNLLIYDWMVGFYGLEFLNLVPGNSHWKQKRPKDMAKIKLARCSPILAWACCLL